MCFVFFDQPTARNESSSPLLTKFSIMFCLIWNFIPGQPNMNIFSRKKIKLWHHHDSVFRKFQKVSWSATRNIESSTSLLQKMLQTILIDIHKKYDIEDGWPHDLTIKRLSIHFKPKMMYNLCSYSSNYHNDVIIQLWFTSPTFFPFWNFH